MIKLSVRKIASADQGKRRGAAVALFLLFLMLIGVVAITVKMNSLERRRAQAENPRSATDLVSFCTSADAKEQEYCDGYIDGATLIWKYGTACASLAQSDQSFCAGVNAAQKRTQEVLQACRDCSIGEFRPELKDSPIHGQLFMERMQKFRDEMKAAMDVCTPGEPHDKYYCAGYNATVANGIAELGVMYPNGESEDARRLGLGDAESDVGLHLLASEEFYEIRPCLQHAIGPQQVKDIFLEFIQENPEQQRGSTAIVVMAKALYRIHCPGAATPSP